MAIILFSSGLTMLLLGLIGEYLGRIYICINESPQYVIKNTINVEGKWNLCGTVVDDIVNDECINQLLLLDVPEHADDDERFLKLLYKKMARGVLVSSLFRHLCVCGAEKITLQAIFEDTE